MKRSIPSTEEPKGKNARTPSTALNSPRRLRSSTTCKVRSISRAAAITPRKLLDNGVVNNDINHHRIVYLIRHGQSKGQVALEHDRRFNEALTDCGLTDVGKRQAANIPNLMDTTKVDLVISSPLTRALETALIAFPEHNKIECNYDLREVGTMIPENLPRKIYEVQADLKGWGLDVSKVDFDSYKPDQWPNRHETPPKVVRRDRIRDVFVQLAEKLPPEINCIAVVCHYHVIRTALSDPFDAKQSREIQKNLQPKNAQPIRCILQADGRLHISPEEDSSDSKER